MNSAASAPRDLMSQLASIDAAANADRQARARAGAERADARRRSRRRGTDPAADAPLATRSGAVEDVTNPDAMVAALGELAARPLEDHVGDQIRALLDRATSPMVRAALAKGLGPTRAVGARLHLLLPGDGEAVPPAGRSAVARDAATTSRIGSAPCGAQPSQHPVSKGAKE